MTTAFVLSGGASLGAIEVGMLEALLDHGVTPDLIVGTSVGAINGAWLAGHPGEGVAELRRIWSAMRRSTIFPADPLRGFFAFAGRRRGLVSQHGVRSLLDRHLGFTRLEDAATPLHVVAVDVLTGREVLLSRGPAVDAVMASAAIPAVFEPVRVGKRWLIDGGVVDNTPISHAVALGADVVWVLCAGYACALRTPPSGALAMGLHALSLVLHRQVITGVEEFESAVELHVLPPLCPLDVSPADFSRSEELMDRGRDQTRKWLAGSHDLRGQSKYLGLHGH